MGPEVCDVTTYSLLAAALVGWENSKVSSTQTPRVAQGYGAPVVHGSNLLDNTPLSAAFLSLSLPHSPVGTS